MRAVPSPLRGFTWCATTPTDSFAIAAVVQWARLRLVEWATAAGTMTTEGGGAPTSSATGAAAAGEIPLAPACRASPAVSVWTLPERRSPSTFSSVAVGVCHQRFGRNCGTTNADCTEPPAAAC